MRFTVATFINDGEGRFFAFDPGDVLDRGPVMAVEASDEMAALDKAFEIGNIETLDANGVGYPHDKFRSISVGDVLAVSADDHLARGVHYFACDRFGWSAVTPDEFAKAVAFGRAKHTHREGEAIRDNYGCRACGVEAVKP